MANKTDSETACKFFALPRELRDVVYGMIGGVRATDERVTRCSPFDSISMTPHPVPALLRVGKQFSHEYRQILQQPELIFYGDEESLGSCPAGSWTCHPALQAALMTTKSVKLALTPDSWEETMGTPIIPL